MNDFYGIKNSIATNTVKVANLNNNIDNKEGIGYINYTQNMHACKHINHKLNNTTTL